MLDLFGRGYVIEHCITSFKNKTQMEMYRIYVTDSMQALANMYSKTHGGTSEIIPKRFYELIHPPKVKEEETAEDIIDRIKKKLGG